MKILKPQTVALALVLLCVSLATQAGDARYYRVSGPVVSRITGLDREGYLTWTNGMTNATFTIQTATKVLGGTNWVDYVRVPVSGAITTNRVQDPNPPTGMALIPAGSFTMGDTFGDWPSDWGANPEIPTHNVHVSGFYMDRTEVTKALWDEVYQWATNHGYSFLNNAQGKAGNHPAQNMTWYDAVKWCNARSEMEGRTPAYYTSATQKTVYREGDVDIYNDCVNWNRGYRLPTEAEWEKSARGGASGQRFSWGNMITHSQANYCSYGSGEVLYYPYDVNPTEGYHPAFATGGYPYTSPAGYFAPNGYGLYDMAGNVWEWCWDWYGSYSSASQSDPRGPTSWSFHMARGGGWDGNAGYCRAANRLDISPSGLYGDVGFRSVLRPGQ
jgi:formylglycine-generating enzyme required for sulfatase activity